MNNEAVDENTRKAVMGHLEQLVIFSRFSGRHTHLPVTIEYGAPNGTKLRGWPL
jgi:hypothetical protein